MIRAMPVLLAAISAVAQPSAQDAMIARSVEVLGAIMQNDRATPVSLGGGFIADAHHVITTAGCCNQTNQGQQKFPVVKIGEELAAGKVVWTGPGQIVILEVQKDLKATPLSVVPSKLFQKGQTVYTVQFPNRGAPSVVESSALGIGQPDKVDAPVISVKAGADSVSPGSALFDACGNVMGINVLVDGGTQFAFVIDTVAGGLQKQQIQAGVADRACGGGSEKGPDKDKGREKDKAKTEPATGPNWRWPQGGEWVGVGMIVALLGLALRRGTRAAQAPATTTASEAVPDPPSYRPAPVTPRVPTPVLRGVAGQYAGTSIPVQNQTVLGRDPHAANVVFTSDADSVSKRHASVRWDAARSVFVIEDLGSTNGTFLANGDKLVSGQVRDLRAGDRFYVGDQRNLFEVMLE